MRIKIKLLIVLFFVLNLTLLNTCTRDQIENPSPVGPSTFSVILDLTLNPNVITAGQKRGRSRITAILKKYDGTPLADRKIHFELGDESGNKINLGYFEGNKSVKTVSTDVHGVARVDYYGPTAEEINSDTSIYIHARASWEGKEFISNAAPLQIIVEPDDIYINVSANPNVLFAGTYREKSTITATAAKAGNKPLANKTIYFEITDENGNRLDLGYFEGGKSVKKKTTDSTGTAQTVYYGPISQEITENTTIYIKVWLSGKGDEYASGETPLYIVKGYS